MTAKVIFACVGCTALGFVAGWGARALVKKKNEELMEESAPEEKKVVRVHMDEDEFNKFSGKTINKIFNPYRGSMFSETEQEAIEEANAEAESPSEEDEDDDDYAEDYSSAPYDPDDDYDDYKPQPRYDQYADDDDEDESEEDVKPVRKNVWPYEITLEEFEEDNGFSKSNLEYYKNNILIDEDGSEITNPGSIVGSGVLKTLLRTKGVAYVRNESLEIDYEIDFVNENYERYDDED